jgi:hypothetical protein
MQTHTITILETTLRTDSTVSAAQRKQILDAARGEPSPAPDGNGIREPRIYSRAEAAKLLGDRSTRFVDLLCRRGLLEKFTPKGNQRSIGITAESFKRFIEGNIE